MKLNKYISQNKTMFNLCFYEKTFCQFAKTNTYFQLNNKKNGEFKLQLIKFE